MHIPKIKLKFLRKLLPKRRRDKNMNGQSRDASIHNRGDPTRSVQAMLVEAERVGPAAIVEGHRDQDQDRHHHQQQQLHQRRPAKSSLRASSQPKGNAPPPSPVPSGNEEEEEEDNDDDEHDDDNNNNNDLKIETAAATTAAATAAAREKAKKQLRRHALPPPPKPAPEECPICHDPIGVRNPEGICEGWTQLHCGHKFGTNCLRIWFQSSLERGDRGGGGMLHTRMPNCPICRKIARPVAPFLIYPPPAMRCHLS